MYTRSGDTTYLFDVSALGKEIFSAGRLKELLESPSVRKIVIDGRADNDALHHLFGVKMVNAYDLQILHAIRENKHSDLYVKGLSKIMAAASVVPIRDRARVEAIKNKGVRLFAPEKGGSYAVWSERPLQKELLDYCACDVKYLLDIKDKWSDTHYDADVLRLTKQRIDKAVNSIAFRKGPHMSKRDFDLPGPQPFLCNGLDYDFDDRPDSLHDLHFDHFDDDDRSPSLYDHGYSDDSVYGY